MNTALISAIQRYSINDGPGIRTTIFFMGCPLRCRWCHNPECLEARIRPMWRGEACLGCGACLAACPQGKAQPGQLPQGCAFCSRCVTACPTGALRWSGASMTLEEVWKAACADRVFYGEQGGITCSGGEPLAQAGFVKDLLTRCKQAGLHTALETALYCDPNVLEALLPVVDLWICDLKCATPALHEALTGVRPEPIWENLRFLFGRNARIWIRLPAIPGIHTPQEMRRMAALLAGLPRPEKIEVLPYHLLGQEKYAQLGEPSPYPSEAAADESLVRDYRREIEGEA